MTKEDFLAQAKNNISDDPKTRISAVTKAVIDKDNFVFDAHAHMFDAKCINVKYLIIRMLEGIPEWFVSRFKKDVLKISKEMSFEKEMFSMDDMIEEFYFDDSPEMALPDLEQLEKNLDQAMMDLGQLEIATTSEKMELFGLGEFYRRLKNIIKILKTGKMSAVHNVFTNKYAVNRVYNDYMDADADQITIVLGMDLNSGWDNSIEKKWNEQNEELAKLASQEAIFPYFPVDPRRADNPDENLYAEFLKAFADDADHKFFGVKCYPSLGYLPSDHRLDPIFEICALKNIPVMTHCGGEMVSTFANPIDVLRYDQPEQISLPRRKHRARFLNEPKEWLPVLERHNKLTLCLGHFGGNGAWKDPENAETAHRIDLIIQMMKDYNVYSDFSFNLESDKSTDNFFERLVRDDDDAKIMQERTMFGTDFWVVLPMSDLNGDQRKFIKKSKGFLDELTKKNVLAYLGV